MEGEMPSSYTVLSEKVGFVTQVDTACGRCLEDHLITSVSSRVAVSPKAKAKEKNSSSASIIL